MTYPMLRRKRIGSHSAVRRPLTRTSPAVGNSSRLISFKVVVLPEPLRPSSTRVSPCLTESTRSCSNGRPFRRKEAWSNSMAELSIDDPWLRGAVMWHTCGALARSRPRLVRAIRQARDPDSAVPFVPDIETDQQRRDLFDDACVLQLPTINRSHASDLRREFHRNLRGIRIIAAYDDIAIDIVVDVAVEYVCRNVLECRCDRNALRNKFRRLLRCRALPHADGATGASAHTRRQRNGSVNQDAARADRRFLPLQQRCLPFQQHCEHQQIARGARSRILHPQNLSICDPPLTDCLRRLLCPGSIARADDDGLSRARPAQRKARARRTGASDDCDGATQSNSETRSHSEETDSTGSLIFMREYFVLRSAGMRPISRINAWKSSGLVYCPAVAPASREIFSSISVPP